jgi:beta-phosphoglucomutase-like phosphatase (HAD superfamily)
MDQITSAIVLGVAGNFATDAIAAAYKSLKNALTKKHGQDSDLVDAVNKLEKTPDRDDRKATVQAEVEIAKANDDAELVKLAQDLLNQLKEQPGGMSAINQTVNAKYAATSGTGNATVSQINDNAPSEDRKK